MEELKTKSLWGMVESNAREKGPEVRGAAEDRGEYRIKSTICLAAWPCTALSLAPATLLNKDTELPLAEGRRVQVHSESESLLICSMYVLK